MPVSLDLLLFWLNLMYKVREWCITQGFDPHRQYKYNHFTGHLVQM